MIVLALVPSVWRRVMDPRVLAHVGGDIGRVNLAPHLRPSAEPVEPADDARDPVSTRSTDGESDQALSWRCPGCGYTYEVVAGDEREGFAAGTAWSRIPEAWCCPDCGVRDRVDFVAVDHEPAS
jgi:alkane 1-monooxygenase